MPVRHTEGNESLFSQLPTVRAAQGDNRNSNIWERDASKPQNLENALYHILPTPSTMEHLPARTGEARERHLRRGGTSVRASSGNLREDILETLPTPKASDGYHGNTKTSAERPAAGFFVDLPNVAVDLMPTPAARDGKDGTVAHSRDGVVQTDTVARAVFNSGEIDLIGTPRATASESSASQVAAGATKGRIEDQVLTTNWGKFEPAIRRWEQHTRPAPAPTKPDGKDGNHRLSSLFTEWMMGLPDGWVTGHGLKRNDELKMCGNGVVPQQAVLALRYLLGETDIPKA
jgi:DNA (cytosine-5)-methyltransferase 1